MKKFLVASIVLGASAIVSSLIVSNNISFKNEHVIPLSGGAIKLGDIYKENKLISAKLIFKDSEQVLVVDGNPDDFPAELEEKIQAILKTINATKRDDEKLTAENLSVVADSTLEVVSAVRYTSEYQPLFTLTLEKKVIPMAKDTVIQPFVNAQAADFIRSQQQDYAKALYLSK